MWSLDLATSTWTEVTPEEAGPTPRSNVRVTFVRGRVLLFGGSDVRGTNDAWSFDPEGRTWRKIETTEEKPPVRWSPAHVWDEEEERLIAFGGTDGAKPLGDLWALELRGRWK